MVVTCITLVANLFQTELEGRSIITLAVDIQMTREHVIMQHQ